MLASPARPETWVEGASDGPDPLRERWERLSDLLDAEARHCLNDFYFMIIMYIVLLLLLLLLLLWVGSGERLSDLLDAGARISSILLSNC